MGGKSDPKMEISEYTMSFHLGICAYGEGIKLLEVNYGEKEIWGGEMLENDVKAINRSNLFGGSKKEGGVKGLLWWLSGHPNQVMPATLAGKFALTSSTCPGFRGLSSIFLTGIRGVRESHLASLVRSLRGHPGNDKDGMYVAANNPYLRSFSARVRRAPIGLDPEIAMMKTSLSSKGRMQYAANPAHIIYECLTNADWGMGESPSVIDRESFDEAAQTLYTEQMGLNLKWSRQTEIGKFIGEILNHIYGALYVSPLTGKHTIKLLRPDYDVYSLPEINESNGLLTNFKRKAWGEIVNEVVVTMTNSESNKEETVTAQDLAAIASQGGITSTSKSYYGVTSRDLAVKLAERDLAMMVNPIATCEVEVSRAFWKTVVNGVVTLSWPEYDIDRLVFRVSEVSNGQNSLKLSLYEDIFGLDYASYRDAGDSEWQNPAEVPEPVSFYQIGTAPAFITASVMGKSDPSELEYPEAMSNVIVAADSNDDVSYDIVTYVADVNGTVSQTDIGTRGYRATFVLLTMLQPAIQTLLPALSGMRGEDPVVGQFIMFGSGADEFTEICTVQEITEDGFLLNRGVLDTIPRQWPSGTRAYILPAVSTTADETIRSTYEDVSYWLLARTSLGLLPLEKAPRINVTLSDRPYKPNRPANVKINGVGFGTVPANGLTSIPVTWANRNRTLESTQVMTWDSADVGGEPGQVTEIVVRTAAGAHIKTYTDLPGTSFSIPVADLLDNDLIIVSIFAKLGARRSLQAYSLNVSLSQLPYLALEGDMNGRLKLSGRPGNLLLQGDF